MEGRGGEKPGMAQAAVWRRELNDVAEAGL